MWDANGEDMKAVVEELMDRWRKVRDAQVAIAQLTFEVSRANLGDPDRERIEKQIGELTLKMPYVLNKPDKNLLYDVLALQQSRANGKVNFEREVMALKETLFGLRKDNSDEDAT